jgi:hypothetical protein
MVFEIYMVVWSNHDALKWSVLSVKDSIQAGEHKGKGQGCRIRG